jgi:hypothetical protein
VLSAELRRQQGQQEKHGAARTSCSDMSGTTYTATDA